MKRTILLTLALTMALAVTGCGSNGNTSSQNSSGSGSDTTSQSQSSASGSQTAGEVMSYEEYMAADLDSQVTVETYVQAKQSWWEDKATLYTQDQDGAYFVYDAACSQELYDQLTPGTKIQVTGYKTELGADTLIDHQNQLVSFKGLTVEPSQDASGNEAAFLYSWDGSGTDGDDLYFNASYNGQTYTFTVESYLCDNTTDVYAAVKALEIGQTIDMEGFLYWYEGVNPHITSVTVAQ